MPLIFNGIPVQKLGAKQRAGPEDCAYAPPYVRALVVTIPVGRFHMGEATREKLLKIALVAFGAIFLLVYPLGLIWPSGWVWHGGEGKYYFQMICGIYAVLGVYLIAAARNPSEHRSLISFAIWSSVVHAGIMAAQSIYDEHERGHLMGDVPALLLVAAVLWFLSPTKQNRSGTA
jgi:hypothetical protein